MAICGQYDIFFIPGDKLSCAGSETLRVPLDRGRTEVHKLEAKQQIETMLGDGIIEHIVSVRFPVILVPKKGTDKNGKRKYR